MSGTKHPMTQPKISELISSFF